MAIPNILESYDGFKTCVEGDKEVRILTILASSLEKSSSLICRSQCSFSCSLKKDPGSSSCEVPGLILFAMFTVQSLKRKWR